jgi:hypothetical protein
MPTCEDEPGAALRLNGGVVQAVAGSLSFTPEQCVVAYMPPSPNAPAPRMQAPQNVGSCDVIVLDASGTVDSTGRGLTYTWSVAARNTVAATAPVFTRITDPAFIRRPSVLVLNPDDLVPGGEFTFTLTVANSFLGTSSTLSRNVSVASVALPKVAIDGDATRTVTANQVLTLSVTGAVSSCAGAPTGVGNRALSYTWSLVSAQASAGTVSGYAVTSIAPASGVLAVAGRDPTKLVLPRLQVSRPCVRRCSVVPASRRCCWLSCRSA